MQSLKLTESCPVVLDEMPVLSLKKIHKSKSQHESTGQGLQLQH